MIGSLPYRVGIVEWRDAHADPAGGWVSPADMDRGEVVVVSCAFVLGLDLKPDHLTICQDVAPTGDVNGVTHIPQAMVKHIRYLT